MMFSTIYSFLSNLSLIIKKVALVSFFDKVSNIFGVVIVFGPSSIVTATILSVVLEK